MKQTQDCLKCLIERELNELDAEIKENHSKLMRCIFVMVGLGGFLIGLLVGGLIR
jgi:hypothetical protein